MSNVNISTDTLLALAGAVAQQNAGLNIMSEAPQHYPIGEYVIVRCKDAGVHAGYLTWAKGRSCGLSESRRLWYWKPANGAAFLSGVAAQGLDSSSKVGVPINIVLTENCEIIVCTPCAKASIIAMKEFTP